MYVETLSSFIYKYKWPVGPMRLGSEVIKISTEPEMHHANKLDKYNI